MTEYSLDTEPKWPKYFLKFSMGVSSVLYPYFDLGPYNIQQFLAKIKKMNIFQDCVHVSATGWHASKRIPLL